MKFGQLHVRTAFPATGGFDEQEPLFCLHPGERTGRLFQRFIASMAKRRSVYAPDMPGCGESDPGPEGSGPGIGAAVVLDLAADLRLRRVDLLGAGDGAGVALDIAIAAPELVRRIVLVGAFALDRLASVSQGCLVLATGSTSIEMRRRAGDLRANIEFVAAPEYSDDPFTLAADVLAERVVTFLDRS